MDPTVIAALIGGGFGVMNIALQFIVDAIKSSFPSEEKGLIVLKGRNKEVHIPFAMKAKAIKEALETAGEIETIFITKHND
jgi:excinuclease UvrABC helicase subunit UvrB